MNKWKHYRKNKANKVAGWSWQIGNLGLMGKSFFENKFDVTAFTSLETWAGALLIASAEITKRDGTTFRGFATSMALCTTGFILLTINAAGNNDTALLPGLILGAITSFGSTAKAIWDHHKAKKQAHTEKDRSASKASKSKLEVFKENAKMMFADYPQIIPMGINFASDFSIFLGALVSGDVYYAILGGLWSVGCANAAIIKQELGENQKDNQDTDAGSAPQPA